MEDDSGTPGSRFHCAPVVNSALQAPRNFKEKEWRMIPKYIIIACAAQGFAKGSIRVPEGIKGSRRE